MKSLRYMKTAVLTAIAVILIAQPALAYVQVRISIKFILNSSGNRPATGRLNTDAEINAEVDWANTILAGDEVFSEYRIQQLELVDISGASTWATATASAANRDAIRAAAIASPTTYRWRTDAINIYITGGTGSAISKFPPTNDIILMNQNCGNTPSCILHELGHSLNLYHTHEPCCSNQDLCADTITDNSGWSKNQIAQSNFGTTYDNLNATQRDQVDLVFNNVMSYHTSEPQLRLSLCQLDRWSTTGDSDRAWMLTRWPVYVRNSWNGSQNGRFNTPYKTLQAAEAAGLNNRVVVLNQGNNPITSAVTIDQNTQLVPRLGNATVGNGALLYELPTDLEQSDNPQIRNAIQAAQQNDEAGRRVMMEAKQAGNLAATEEDRARIEADAEARRDELQDNAISHLRDAEKFAQGEDRVAILMEIAQRYRDSDRCDDASVYFNLAAETTKQVHLRDHALYQANHCRELLDMKRYGISVKPREDMPEEEHDN